ncbi:tetratricopeptide repeat protein [Methylobacterium sp. B4]|uniref:SEL1-like repeat protein n=1 Tax=Methylobacterium sp. B4 TaxID=1938755 RepID=UPI000D770D5C|nr:tetratricopeptide repeat protein [Methylobacterium sp. B4]PXW66480.1 localization factor PodJL [Methylobacterium sp. B4]
MKQTAPISLDSFDPEVLAAAREVARRAGVPLESWIESVAKPDKPAPRRRRTDVAPQTGQAAPRETDEVAASESSPAQEPPRTRRRDGAPPREKAVVMRGTPLEVSLDAMMRRLDALDRTISAEREASKAEAARMIGEIEARFSATQKPAAAEEIAEVMTERFADIERKVGEIAGQLGAPRPLGRRGRPIASEVREAVAEVRRRQRELEEGIAGWNAAGAVAAPVEAPVGWPVEHRDEGHHDRLETDQQNDRHDDLPASDREQGRNEPSPAIAELQRETGRLRESLSGLATSRDVGELEQTMRAVTSDLQRARDPGEIASIAAPVELMRVQVDRLAADVTDNVHARIVGDVERLAAKVEGVLAAAPSGPADQGALERAFRELDEIRQLVGALAAPERILGLAQGVQAISTQIAELQRGEEAGVAVLRPLLEEIRGELKAPDETRALLDRFEALAERIDRAETGPVGELVGRLETLAAKVDRVSAGGGGLDALERHVLALADRLDAPRGSDPALVRLERSMGDLLAQVSALRDGAHLDAAIERAAREAAAGAAAPLKAASGEFGLLRADLADLRANQKNADQRLHATLEGVQGVLARLSEQLDRTMTSAAALAAGAPSQAPAPQERSAGERVSHERPAAPQAPARAGAPALGRPRPPVPAEPLVLSEAGRAPEELLEPGAGRPGSGRPAAGEANPAPGGADIKTSFIAAARRAAQAAQAEAAEPPLTARLRDKMGSAGRMAGGSSASPAAATGESGPLSRVRGMFESRRRTLLLGLAAVVLALGAYQAFLAGKPDPSGDVAATDARPAETPPAADASVSRTAESKPETAPVQTQASASAPAASQAAPQDPTTTQSIAAKASDKAPAAGKRALPQVAGMASLSPDLAGLPPALSKLKQDALAGDAAAIWDLASREAEGRGVPRDLGLAAKLYERLAAAGFAPAQVKTGNAYEKGNGVVRDIAQARLWYGRAADQGNVRAMHNLAVLHAENPAANGKPDFAAAASAFRRAAEHGVRDSQYNLAVLYARGLGVGQDLVQSYLWFSAAAAQGDEEAGRKRDEVATKLSPKDLTEAKAVTASFKAKSVDPAANEVPSAKDAGPAPMSLMGAPSPGLPNLSSIPKRAGA